jgi:acyl-CoA synthetase (AMP-forming)/AMP-acid ligase II
MRGDQKLYHQLLHWAKEKGASPAITEITTGKVITYEELLFAINTLATYLGEKPQTIVVTLPGGIVDSVLWLVSLISGHLFIPLSPNTTDFEFEESIQKYNPTLFVSEDTSPLKVNQIKHLTLTKCNEIISHNPHTNDKQFQTKEGRVHLSTSGSTGKPKGMLLTTTNIVITAQEIIKIHQLTKRDRGLTPLPFYHVNAPVVSLISTILSGGQLIIAPRYSTSQFWSWVKEYDPTWISIVPTIVAMLLTTRKPNFLKQSNIRFVRTASAPLPAIFLKRFEKKFHLPLIETYGISEAASTICANPLPPKVHKPGSVGLPIGIKLKIVDPKTFEDVPTGKSGEVWIKGKQVIKGYEDNMDPESFHLGWFRTGDLGHQDTDGYIFLTGRKKEVIIRGGENISPREIEDVLLLYPHIQEVAVVGQPDMLYGEKIAAFIVFGQKKYAASIEIIKEFAGKKLSRQKIPTEIFILDSLPRGKTNKIDKKFLKTYTKK